MVWFCVAGLEVTALGLRPGVLVATAAQSGEARGGFGTHRLGPSVGGLGRVPGRQNNMTLVWYFCRGIPTETFLRLRPGTTHALFIGSVLNIQVLRVTHGNTKRLLMFHRVCQLKPPFFFYLETTHLSVDYVLYVFNSIPSYCGGNSAKQNKTHIRSRARSTE